MVEKEKKKDSDEEKKSEKDEKVLEEKDKSKKQIKDEKKKSPVLEETQEVSKRGDSLSGAPKIIAPILEEVEEKTKARDLENIASQAKVKEKSEEEKVRGFYSEREETNYQTQKRDYSTTKRDYNAVTRERINVSLANQSVGATKMVAVNRAQEFRQISAEYNPTGQRATQDLRPERFQEREFRDPLSRKEEYKTIEEM